MSFEGHEALAPEVERPPRPDLGTTPKEADGSPVAIAALKVIFKDVTSLWKRIERRAPEAVQAHVNEVIATGEALLAEEDPPVRARVELSKRLVDLQAELRGRQPWEATFYRDGRLVLVRAQDPIKIRGAVDHARIERFYARYVRQAEAAYERLQYFLDRAGALSPEEKKVERKPWEEPYIALDTYRELIWGKVQKKDPHVRRE